MTVNPAGAGWTSMEVYLIPLGPGRDTPYCEVHDSPGHEGDDPTGRGWFRGLQQKFHEVLRAAEGQRVQAEDRDHPPSDSWSRRLRDHVLGFLAEKVAEQRLLWHLRRQPAATLVYPSDLTEPDAMSRLRRSLQGDADRHLRWLVVNAALFVASGLFMLIPGPNLIAYYFAFRTVGHWFSLQGARHGLRDVSWSTRPSDVVAELREAIGLDPVRRAQRVRDVASRLRLDHLARFVERITPRSA